MFGIQNTLCVPRVIFYMENIQHTENTWQNITHRFAQCSTYALPLLCVIAIYTFGIQYVHGTYRALYSEMLFGRAYTQCCIFAFFLFRFFSFIFVQLFVHLLYCACIVVVVFAASYILFATQFCSSKPNHRRSCLLLLYSIHETIFIYITNII